jgi:hypothetical protein
MCRHVSQVSFSYVDVCASMDVGQTEDEEMEKGRRI